MNKLFYYSFDDLKGKRITKNLVDEIGLKTVGLLNLPIEYVPQFIVLTSSFCSNFIGSEKIKKDYFFVHCILRVFDYFISKGVESVIIRSSANTESLNSRGKYKSSLSRLDLHELFENIKDVILYFNKIEKNNNCKLAIIIQEYKTPIFKGHLSNEYRVSHKKNEFLIETETCDHYSGTININHNINFPNYSDSFTSFIQWSEYAARFLYEKYMKRFHIEWIQANEKYWIVQLDFDLNIQIKKIKDNSFSFNYFNLPERTLFKNINNVKINSNKITSIKFLKEEILLPIDFLTLNDTHAFTCVINNKLSAKLKLDFSEVFSNPVIIRTDIIKNKIDDKSLLLPKSDIINDPIDAISFIKFVLIDLTINKGISIKNIVFIIHKFIYAKKSAIARINIEKNTIDISASYGIPDSMLYFNHDNYTLLQKTFELPIEKKITYKDKFLQINKQGKWQVIHRANRVKKETLNNDELKAIYDICIKVIKKYKEPVNIMFFCGVTNFNKQSGVIPWHFHKIEKYTEDIPAGNFELYSTIKIKSKQDLKILNQITKPTLIYLQPSLSFIRDIKVINEIAEKALRYSHLVKLNGSKLSHIYYILSSKGVKVV